MPDFSQIYDLIPRILPFECLEARFMQTALVGLLLLAPMAAAMGVQVVNFRMAFFSDAISHSAFTGVALGLVLSMDPAWSMPVFGVAVGLAIMFAQRRSRLSEDTVTGVVFSAVVAFGLAVVSRDRSVARDMQRFLYGDILTISENEVMAMAMLFVAVMCFQAWSYNRLLYIGINPTLARTHRVGVAVYQYVFSGLLALIVVFAVGAVGVFMVTALLIVPAAAARNIARSAGSMFWWAIIISFASALPGLLISAQPWAGTAAGATVVLVAFVWFMISLAVAFARGESKI